MESAEGRELFGDTGTKRDCCRIFNVVLYVLNNNFLLLLPL